MADERPRTCLICGWSGVTTYHGLRTHQGRNGCTPKGLRIPENDLNNESLSNQATPEAAPVQLFDSDTDSQQGSAQGQSQGPFKSCTEQKVPVAAVKEENVPIFGPTQPQMNANKTQRGCDRFSGAQQPESFSAQPTNQPTNTDVTAKEEKQLFCGPLQVQFNFFGNGNNTLKGYDWSSGAQQPGSLDTQPTAANTEVQEENQLLFQLLQFSLTRLLEELVISNVAQQTTSTRPAPAAAEATSNQENKPMFERPQQPFQSSNNGNKNQRASHLTPGTQPFASVPVSLSPNTKPTSTASDVTVKEAPITQPSPTSSGAIAKKPNKPSSQTPAATSTGAQQAVPIPVSQSSSVTPEAAVQQGNKTSFETPQQNHQSATGGNKTRSTTSTSVFVRSDNSTSGNHRATK